MYSRLISGYFIRFTSDLHNDDDDDDDYDNEIVNSLVKSHGGLNYFIITLYRLLTTQINCSYL